MTDGSAETGRGRPKLADQRSNETVYRPAEDSKLLADTAVDHVAPTDRVLDVGTGSGYVASRIASETGASVLASEVNPAACRQAREAGIAVVRADIVSPFRDSTFDVVVCNPPYLPTPPDREWDDWMERALSGGPDGRAVIDPFVRAVGRVLRPDGVAYLLLSTLSDPEAVRELAEHRGFDVSTVASESHPFERLLVFELRPGDGSAPDLHQ